MCFYASVAQLAELVILTHKVGGSIPFGCTNGCKLAAKLLVPVDITSQAGHNR